MWIALKLVSLSYWKQLVRYFRYANIVVNCSQISIFVLLETTSTIFTGKSIPLWIALKLVSLSYWKQPYNRQFFVKFVVNCSQISIFVLLETTEWYNYHRPNRLWIALKLVSLSYWKQLSVAVNNPKNSCELLSN